MVRMAKPARIIQNIQSSLIPGIDNGCSIKSGGAVNRKGKGPSEASWQRSQIMGSRNSLTDLPGA